MTAAMRLLVAGCCVSAALIGLELGAPPTMVQTMAEAGTAAAPGLLPGGPDDAAATLLARPPFDPLRRPAAAAGSARDTGLPVLTGIVVTPRDRQAIFAAVAGRPSTIVKPGDALGGYRVQSIGAREVTLAGADGLHTVRLRYDRVPASAPAAVAQIAPAAADPVFPPLPARLAAPAATGNSR